MHSANSSGRAIGIYLITASASAVIFMAIHPVSAKPGFVELLHHFAKSQTNGIVHGAMLGFLVFFTTGFSFIANRLGTGLLLVRTGLFAFLLSIAFGITAGITDGFIIPSFAERYISIPTDQHETIRPILALCRVVNQTSSRAEVISASLSVLLWSLQFVHRRDFWIAGIGALVAGIPLILLISGNLPMNIHGFGGFVVAQAIWAITLSIQLIRNRL